MFGKKKEKKFNLAISCKLFIMYVKIYFLS